MYVINQVVRNYGISIVLFTLVVKLLMFPASYNQQKNMALMQTINPKIAKLKKSFSNNPQKLQMEQSKLMQEEGINPYASCLPTIITMFVLMGVYRVVNRPLTHILHLKDQAGEAQTLLSAWLAEHDMTEKYMSSRPELIIMQYADSHPEIFSSMNGFVEKVKGFDNSILGIIDLGAQPSLHPDGGWTGTAIALAAIPFLSGLIQLFLTIYSQYHQKKTNPDAPNMGGMTAMLYIMPIFSIVFAFSVPAGVGFYWMISSFFSLLQTILLYRYFTPARSERIAEKEKEKNKAKKPGFMQRMMEQQQQMMEQQNGGNGNGGNANRPAARGASNRVEYSDNLSRSELNEFNRQRINDARRRMAEKYGDDYNEKD